MLDLASAKIKIQNNTEKSVLVSICIVNWNTKDYLCACIESIKKFCKKNQVEIIVVDNASADGSAEMVKILYPNLKLIENSENRGYAYANNQAFRSALGEYILILNPDTVIPYNIFDKLIRKMETNPEIGVLSCRLRNMDGSIQQFCYGLPTISDEIFMQTGLDRKYPLNRAAGHRKMKFFAGDAECETEQPPGTFLFTRKKVIDEIGGFDESFPIFYNDVDWCNRVRKAGWKIVFTPAVYVYHHKSASIKKNFIFCLKEEFVMRRKYYAKYYGNWAVEFLSWFSPFGKDKNSLFPCTTKTKKILLIKSSFDEHFEQFVKSVKEQFPESKIDLLLLSFNPKKTADYSAKFNRIIGYSGKNPWISCWSVDRKIRKFLWNEKYDFILFPHSNIDGAGYWNIIFFSLLLFPAKIGAFSVSEKWSFFRSIGFKQCRGFFVYITAYLLLLIKSCISLISKKV